MQLSILHQSSLSCGGLGVFFAPKCGPYIHITTKPVSIGQISARLKTFAGIDSTCVSVSSMHRSSSI